MAEKSNPHTALLNALGPLAALYSDPAVLEIMVDSPERVLVERNGKLEEAGIKFDSEASLHALIDAVLAQGSLKLEVGQTIFDSRFVDGSRVLAVFPPTAPKGPTLVIRKLIPPAITWDALFRFGSVTQEAYDLLQEAIREHKNILVAGGTGSGKTTVLRLLAESIPADERLVIAESSHELQIHHPRAVFLEAGGQAKISLPDLISTAAKMRPDWLVIGELLGEEAMRAVEVMGRGHCGMTTIHATSPEDALSRLEAMCLMSNLGLGLGEIRNLIASAMQVIISQQKFPDGRRRITHYVELRGIENDRYMLQPLYRYQKVE